ncbi:hypothetical protein NE463_20890, partial [Anaerotruncus colihominis]|nr:hypothetical protein [Anaerotruncus colihominis]
VPTGGLPLDVGAVVCNASTLLNVADAAAGKKVVEKYVITAHQSVKIQQIAVPPEKMRISE